MDNFIRQILGLFPLGGHRSTVHVYHGDKPIVHVYRRRQKNGKEKTGNGPMEQERDGVKDTKLMEKLATFMKEAEVGNRRTTAGTDGSSRIEGVRKSGEKPYMEDNR